MGILDRFSRVIKSNVNSVLDGAEDPEKMVKQTITEMEETIRQGRKEVVTAMANEKMIAKKMEELLRKAKDWENKAMLALKSGDEELAREALKRKKKVEAEADDQEGQRREAAAYVDDIRSRIEEAEKKVEELRNSQGRIAARVRSARQQSEGRTSSGKSAAMDKFDHLSSKIENMEAEVEAASVLDDGRLSESELERRFARLNRDQREADPLDDELAALKDKLK
jgi:phage shock protein A